MRVFGIVKKGFQEHPLIKVANELRNFQPVKIDGTLTYNN